MEITVDKLLNGKPTVIKDRSYFATKEYVNPFFDTMSKFTDKFVVNVLTPDQMTLTDNDEDITYNRVWVQAVMPESNCIDNHDEVYGLIYGLDVRTPVYKVYRGMLNRACTNLCVFDPQWQQVQELTPGEQFTYNINFLMEKVSNFEETLKSMKNTYLPSDPEIRHERLGNWIELSMLNEQRNAGGKVKMSPGTVIKAYEDVYMDSSSKYYVGSEQESTIFNFYNAFTEIVKDDKKDIMNKFEKTILINNLFGL